MQQFYLRSCKNGIYTNELYGWFKFKNVFTITLCKDKYVHLAFVKWEIQLKSSD